MNSRLRKLCTVGILFLALLVPGSIAHSVETQDPALTCSTAPCVTSNVQISPSTSSSTVAGFSLAANPASSSHQLGVTANFLTNMSNCYSSGGTVGASGVWTSGTRARHGRAVVSLQAARISMPTRIRCPSST